MVGFGMNGGFNANIGANVNANFGAGVNVNIGGSVNFSAGFNLGATVSIGNPGLRSDPYLAHHFIVELDGLIAGGFSDVSGLSIQVEVEKKSFGGENEVEYKFVKGVKYTDLVLKRGICDPEFLWQWYEKVINGTIERKDGTIYLLNQDKIPVRGWHFFDAYPIKWDGPALNAATNTIATESLTITHRQLIRAL